MPRTAPPIRPNAPPTPILTAELMIREPFLHWAAPPCGPAILHLAAIHGSFAVAHPEGLGYARARDWFAGARLAPAHGPAGGGADDERKSGRQEAELHDRGSARFPPSSDPR